MSLKMCFNCGTKPRTSTMAYCRACANARARAEYAAGRGRDNTLRWRYGITTREYDVLLEKQHGTCAICKSTPGIRRLVVDHNHVTGKVRGLLCDACNQAIGKFRDDIALLQSAIDYLLDTQTGE